MSNEKYMRGMSSWTKYLLSMPQLKSSVKGMISVSIWFIDHQTELVKMTKIFANGSEICEDDT